MSKIINLTEHAIHVMDEAGELRCAIEPSGTVAKVHIDRFADEEIMHAGITFRLHRTRAGSITGVPEPIIGTFYVVSRFIALALKEEGRTHDIIVVDLVVRDDGGVIVGCRGFARV
jgi:hypothetical protein